MADLRGFDARNVEQMDDFEPIQAGKYVAAIVASEMKPTKAGDGSFLELQFQVLEGPHKGRILWDRLNLDNPSSLAVKIARSQLAAICKAVGVMTPGDSTELHDLPLLIKVGRKRREDTGDVVNEVKGYGKKPAVSPPVQESNGAPPWKR